MKTQTNLILSFSRDLPVVRNESITSLRKLQRGDRVEISVLGQTLYFRKIKGENYNVRSI